MLFKVIQGHRFWYQSKACDCIVINTNLLAILHCFQVMADYMSNFIFAIDRGMPHFNTPLGLGVIPMNIWITLPLQKLDGLSYKMQKTAQSYLHSSGHNTKV